MASDQNCQIKGLIRFSYQATGGFRLTKQPQEDVAKVLQDPDRLRRRLELFRRFTLPSLVGQADQNFKVAVLIGDKMPSVFRAELEGLLEPHAFAQVVALPPMDHYQAMQSAFAHIPATQTATHIASFRLDDDDAIHTATTAQIRKIANGIMRIRDDDRPFMIGFMRGYFLSIEDDEAVVSAVTERYPLGIALTMVAPVSSTKNVFVHNNHRSVAEKVDMYTDVSRPMFIRTVHNLNDSSAVNSGHMWALKTKADWEEFHRSFQIDLDGVSLHTLWGSP